MTQRAEIDRLQPDGSSQGARTAISFTNRNGHCLFGILHEPDNRHATDLGIILLSPGIKMRVGPERLYVRMTELFVAMGIPVLRFDFFGLGDSEGALPEQLLKDVYNHIEVVRFVDDTIDAMDWMRQQLGTNRFILSGLCGGAITGLLTGRDDSRVAGLLALGITPLLASQSADPSRYMSSGQLNDLGDSYLQKLLDPKSWLRLLTLRTDYRMLGRSLAQRLFGAAVKPSAASASAERDNANPLFPPAFFRMLTTHRPMLLVFGGSDRLHWEFEEKFVRRHSDTLASLPGFYQVHTIEHANHVLSFTAWQREMLAVSEAWLRKHFQADLKQVPPAAVR